MNIVKTAIRDVLKKKGSLTNAKLRKAVLKVLAEDYPEGKEHEFNSKFDTELNSLVCKNKVAESDDKYHIPEDGPIDNKIGAVAVNIEPSSSSSSSKRKSADEQPAAKATKHVKIDDSGDTTEKASMKELWNTGEKHWREGTFEAGYLEKNPDRITRLFCGNLNKKMTEDDIKGCLSGITHIKWITDKETGEFYGSSFLEMKDAGCAAAAVAMDKQKFMGRPLKIFYCPPRPGDVWPPVDRQGTGKGTVAGNGPPRRDKSAKPEGGVKLFAGNLSYNIDDEAMVDFFKECGGKITGLRWLTRQGSEEFRGCAFLEFDSTGAADEAMKQDGKELLGRNIRLDWG